MFCLIRATRTTVVKLGVLCADSIGMQTDPMIGVQHTSVYLGSGRHGGLDYDACVCTRNEEVSYSGAASGVVAFLQIIRRRK